MPASAHRTPLPYGPAGTWGRLTLGLLVLGLLELLAGHFIVQRVFGETAALVIDVVLGAVTVALIVALASPLWAAPHLDHERSEVVADFGLLGGARIPLASIVDVTEHYPSVVAPVDPGAAVTGDPPRATFSRGGGGGFVLLRLGEPVVVRHSLRRRTSADEVLLQAADPATAVSTITTSIRKTSGHG